MFIEKTLTCLTLFAALNGTALAQSSPQLSVDNPINYLAPEEFAAPPVTSLSGLPPVAGSLVLNTSDGNLYVNLVPSVGSVNPTNWVSLTTKSAYTYATGNIASILANSARDVYEYTVATTVRIDTNFTQGRVVQFVNKSS